MDQAIEKLKTKYGQKLQENVNLAPLTTLKIGGPARYFFEAKSEEELIGVIRDLRAENIPFLVIGGGSNLLVNDTGTDDLVIKVELEGIDQEGNKTSSNLKSAVFSPTENRIKVQPGTNLQKLVDYSIEHKLAGLNKLTGVPGTVGGAVYGNAGAYGQSISDKIVEVKYFDGQEIKSISKADCQFDYRDSIFKKQKLTVLETVFELELTEDVLKTEADQIFQERLKKYPVGIKCPGSFFKNVAVERVPEENIQLIDPGKIRNGRVHVGFLLESVGAKGMKSGEIIVTDYHANLFVNMGLAKAVDLYNLAKELATRVYEKYGIELEPEVQFVNLPPLF